MIESIHGCTASRVRWDDMEVTNFACLHMFNALDEMAVYFFRPGCPPLSTFFSFVFFGLFFMKDLVNILYPLSYMQEHAFWAFWSEMRDEI